MAVIATGWFLSLVVVALPAIVEELSWRHWKSQRAAEDAFREAQREADARRYADDSGLR